MSAQVDSLLYDELEIGTNATAERIRHAYRKLALKHHPDKNPNGAKKFSAIKEAYDVLSDAEKKKKYDAQGFKAVTKRDPTSKGEDISTGEGTVKMARDEFDDYIGDLDDEVDQEIDDLLDWWSDGQLDTSNAKACLRVDTNDLYDLLVVAYDQYRLTHRATTSDDRSNVATPAILDFVEKHFGHANRVRLNDWNATSPLEPIMNGSYYGKSGELVKVPSRETPRQLPPDLDIVHVKATEIFEELLLSEPKDKSNRALKSLKAGHGKQYRTAWKKLKVRERFKGNVGKKAWDGFKTTVDWTEIADDLAELTDSIKKHKETLDVSKLKVAELKWQTHMKDYGFPLKWDHLVTQYISSNTEIAYPPSKFKPQSDSAALQALQPSVEDEDETNSDGGTVSTGPTNGEAQTDSRDRDGDTKMTSQSTKVNPEMGVATDQVDGADKSHSQDLGDLPDAPVTVLDGATQRIVFGWRTRNMSKQLFLQMTPPKAKFHFYEIVNGRLWQRTLSTLTTPGNDVARFKVDSSFLKTLNYSDLIWVAIARWRREIVPVGGNNNQVETQIFFEVRNKKKEGLRMVARRTMGGVYGQATVDFDIGKKIQISKQKPSPRPERKTNAIKYAQMLDETDSETEDSEEEGEGEQEEQEEQEEDEEDEEDEEEQKGQADAQGRGNKTKLLTNKEAREEDSDIEEITKVLRRMMRGRQKVMPTKEKVKPRRPTSPIPRNTTEARLLEREIAMAQERLKRYNDARRMEANDRDTVSQVNRARKSTV